MFKKRLKQILLVAFTYRTIIYVFLYLKFVKQYFRFKKLAQGKTRFELKWNQTQPCLLDATQNTNYDRHYLYHTAWAARILAATKPEKHYDFSSSLRFVSIVSAFVPIIFFDYRPAKIELSNFETKSADLTNLHFPDACISSLSCMHVVEHIGLGRYGEPFDYNGDTKAMSELARILAPQGLLLFVVPIGKVAKIQFNGHRIYTKMQIIDFFTQKNLVLKEFILIPEAENDGALVTNPSDELLEKQSFACGCFLFTKL